MRKPDLDAMAFEDLWLLHEEITKVLSARISAEKLELEKRLAHLNPSTPFTPGDPERSMKQQQRRHYPKVTPKYRNPMRPSETWSGRGKQPHWLRVALQSGQRLEDLEISDTGSLAED